MSIQRTFIGFAKLASSSILASLLLYCSPATSVASDTWIGNLTDGTRVELKKDVELDSKPFDYGLHYEGDMRCAIGARISSTENDIITLNISNTSGGKCDCLYNGKMNIQLEKKQPNHLAIESKCTSEILKHQEIDLKGK